MFSQSGVSLNVLPYEGVWRDKATSMQVVVDVGPNQAGTIFFSGVRNSRGVEGIWRGTLLPLSGIQGEPSEAELYVDQNRKVFLSIQRLNDDLLFYLVTSNFTNYLNHRLLIIDTKSQSDVALLDPVVSSNEGFTTVHFSTSLEPGSYQAKFQYCMCFRSF